MYHKVNTQEPVNSVSLKEARRQCRMFDEDNSQDERLTGLILVAEKLAQSYTKRQLSKSTVTATWLSYSRFTTLYGGDSGNISEFYCFDNHGNRVDIEGYKFNPVSEVLTVPYDYTTYTDFTITYDCGYSSVPVAVKQGVLNMVSTMFTNSDDFVTGLTVSTIPLSSKDILDTVRFK